MKRTFTLAFFLTATLSISAQSMVENIRTTTERRGTSIITPFVFNGAVYFSADDQVNGSELWRSDGTPGGTYMVRDINPGPASSSPTEFTIHNGELYFSAKDETSGRELWKTDGTSMGTILVADVRTGRNDGNPTFLTSYNGQLYFTSLYGGALLGTAEGYDRQMWRTIPGGAEPVMDLWGSNDDRIQNLTVVGGSLFFTGRDATNIGLWRIVANTMTFIYQGNISSLITSGATLYFRSGSFSSPNDLMKWEEATGITLLKTYDSFSGYSLSNLTNANGRLFFIANEDNPMSDLELWTSDGTIAGTVLVKDLRPGTQSSQATNFLAVGNTVFFTANNGTNGTELWRSDGTDAGTYMVKDISPGSGNGNISEIIFLPDVAYPLGGQLFFKATSGNDLWKSDGTGAGTLLVKDFYPGSPASSATGLTVLGNKIVLSAADPVNGREIWVTDGTDAGSILIKNVVTEEHSSFRDGDYGEIYNPWYAQANGTLFFSALDAATGFEMYRTNAGSLGATMVRDLNAGGSSGGPEWTTNINGKVTFRGSDGNSGNELWITDGSDAGTSLVGDIRPGSQSGFPMGGVSVAGIYYFTATNGTLGYELWRSDGTIAGTYLLKDIRVGASGSEITNMTVVGNVVYFVANDGVSGYELWKTDGTEAGTVRVKDIRVGAGGGLYQYASNNELKSIGGFLYFRASDGSPNDELWRTDGTELGTIKLTTQDKFPKYITGANGKVFFHGQVPGSLVQEELFVYDPGTTIVARLTNCCPFSETARPSHLLEYNGLLYFNGYTPEYGWELGISDGNSVTWIDLIPGKESSNPQHLTRNLNRFYFSASSRDHGVELWQSDGTISGTTMVSDIFPGAQGSNPQQFISANGSLYFIANDGIADYELWSFNPMVQYSLPVGDAIDSVMIQWKNIVMVESTNELLATIRQSGLAPLNDKVVVKVTIDPTIQQYNGNAYAQRHYDIEPAINADNATAEITLYFTQADFDNYNLSNGALGDLPTGATDETAKSSIRILQFHGVGTAPGNYPGSMVTINPDDNNITWNAASGIWEVTFSVTGFSGFYLTTIEAATLPVDILSFEGQLQGSAVALTWVVEHQDGILYYVVERSENGTSFLALDTVMANTFSSFTYHATDARPIVGSNYYRLLILDQDGTTKYSRIVRIDHSLARQINLYPNPASRELVIKSNDRLVIGSRGTIYDNGGKMLRAFTINSQLHSIDVSRLPAGVYYLQVEGLVTMRFVKE